MIETPEWMSESLCLKKHGDIWFPPFETSTPELYYQVARTVCNVCPVWEQCADIGKKEVYGMWGGLTPQERLPLQKDARAHLLGEHGSVLRYRQGCRCSQCTSVFASREKATEAVLSLIPNQNEDFDIKNVAERLQST